VPADAVWYDSVGCGVFVVTGSSDISVYDDLSGARLSGVLPAPLSTLDGPLLVDCSFDDDGNRVVNVNGHVLELRDY
jgi:hypothetical protein